MSAIEPLCREIGMAPKNLSKKESVILEAELFFKLYKTIRNKFKESFKEYFHLINFDTKKENAMVELNFIRLLVQDILESDAYNLSGIACYTQTPEDVIHDLILKPASNPVLIFARKLIELHRSVRPDLYQGIMKKISVD